MNAHFSAADAAMLTADPTRDFLRKMSVEITPKQIEKLDLLRQKLPSGCRVFIALIDPAMLRDRSTPRASSPTPVSSRCRMFLPASCATRRIFAAGSPRWRRRGASQMLVLGGGAPQPIGIYDAAIQLLKTGVFQANGVKRIGIAGHPEGNPDITRFMARRSWSRRSSKSRPI